MQPSSGRLGRSTRLVWKWEGASIASLVWRSAPTARVKAVHYGIFSTAEHAAFPAHLVDHIASCWSGSGDRGASLFWGERPAMSRNGAGNRPGDACAALGQRMAASPGTCFDNPMPQAGGAAAFTTRWAYCPRRRRLEPAARRAPAMTCFQLDRASPCWNLWQRMESCPLFCDLAASTCILRWAGVVADATAGPAGFPVQPGFVP